MPSPFPLGKDENYDDNIDIDEIIMDKLFPVTVVTPDDSNDGRSFWELWEPKESPSPNWFWNPEDI
jgi:hypothetical protein